MPPALLVPAPADFAAQQYGVWLMSRWCAPLLARNHAMLAGAVAEADSLLAQKPLLAPVKSHSIGIKAAAALITINEKDTSTSGSRLTASANLQHQSRGTTVGTFNLKN